MRLQNHRLMNRSRRIAVTGSQANESQPQNHRYRIAASNRSCRITVTGSLLQISAAELQLQNRQNRIVKYRIVRIELQKQNRARTRSGLARDYFFTVQFSGR